MHSSSALLRPLFLYFLCGSLAKKSIPDSLLSAGASRCWIWNLRVMRRACGRGSCRVNEAVVTAFDAGMILVAGDQNAGMLGGDDVRRSRTADFTAIVDELGSCYHHGGARKNQRIQVDARPALFPQKPMRSTVVEGKRLASHLALRVDAEPLAVRICSYSPQSDQYSIAPEEPVADNDARIAGNGREADNLSGVIDPVRMSETTP
jgi:hypothetical protein